MKVALQHRTEAKWVPQLCLLSAKIGFPRTGRRTSHGPQISPLVSSDLSSVRPYFNHQKRAVCKLVAQRQTADDECLEKMVKLDDEATPHRRHQSPSDHWALSRGDRPCATDHASSYKNQESIGSCCHLKSMKGREAASGESSSTRSHLAKKYDWRIVSSRPKAETALWPTARSLAETRLGLFPLMSCSNDGVCSNNCQQLTEVLGPLVFPAINSPSPSSCLNASCFRRKPELWASFLSTMQRRNSTRFARTIRGLQQLEHLRQLRANCFPFCSPSQNKTAQFGRDGRNQEESEPSATSNSTNGERREGERRSLAGSLAGFSLGCTLCTGGFLFWQFYPEKSRRGIPPTCCSYWDTDWDIDFATSAATSENAESNTTRSSKPQRRRRNVLLIRHGQYQNVGQFEDNIQGLTELGFKQAEATGHRLQQLLQGKRVNAIYHSTMKRSIETAKAVSAFFHDVDVTQDPDISEGVPVVPVPSSPTFKPTEKEISKDHPRIERAFRRHIHRPTEDDFEDTFDILVCHGNVIRYMFCRALQFRGEAWLRLATYNCGVTWLTIDEEGYVTCREFGNVGHLKAEDITYH